MLEFAESFGLTMFVYVGLYVGPNFGSMRHEGISAQSLESGCHPGGNLVLARLVLDFANQSA